MAGRPSAIKLFLDLDDTLVDFTGPATKLLGHPMTEETEHDMWVAIKKTNLFWSQLRFLPDGKELWNGICERNLPATILTGVPALKGHQQPAVTQKLSWCKTSLGPSVPVICCAPNANKLLHTAPNCILIDDDIKMKGPWEAAGGSFILRTTAKETLRVLDRTVQSLTEGRQLAFSS